MTLHGISSASSSDREQPRRYIDMAVRHIIAANPTTSGNLQEAHHRPYQPKSSRFIMTYTRITKQSTSVLSTAAFLCQPGHVIWSLFLVV